jgi:hypothetical protein
MKFNGLSPLSPSYWLQLKFIFANSLRNNCVKTYIETEYDYRQKHRKNTRKAQHFYFIDLIVLHVSAKGQSHHRTKKVTKKRVAT